MSKSQVVGGVLRGAADVLLLLRNCGHDAVRFAWLLFCEFADELIGMAVALEIYSQK